MPLDYNGEDINGFFNESEDGTKLTIRPPITTLSTPNIELSDTSNQFAIGNNNEVTIDVETTSNRTATLVDYTNDTDILQGRAGVILGGYTLGVPLSGDVSGLPSSTSVDFVGGKTDEQVSTSVDDTIAATHLNTVSTIVKRDASGDVAVSSITANNLNDNGARFSTGVISGGLLTINGGDNTKFDISDGVGVIVDHSTTPYSLTNVTWTGQIGLSITYLATNLISFISIDINGDVLQSAIRPTVSSQRDNIFLGVLVHVNKTNLDTTNDEQSFCSGPFSQLHDLMEAIGFLNISGNLFSAYSTTMEMQKSFGVMFAHGANYKNDIKNPNYVDLPGLSPATFQYRTQLGVNTVPDNTVIDPDYWDDGGTLTLLGPNKWTIQRIFVFTSNNVKIQWGQTVYNSLDAAETGVTDAFVIEPSIVDNGLFVAYLIVKSGETNLSNSTFISAGKFGNAQGSGTPSGLETLQGVYNNSSLKQIDISAGALAFTGEALTTEHIIPADDSLYNLGDNVIPQRWANVYSNTIACAVLEPQSLNKITIEGSLIPSDDWNYSLGSLTTRWGSSHISSVYVGWLVPETGSTINHNGISSMFREDGTDFADDEEMIRFNMEGSRDWVFVKRLSGASTSLSLESITDQKHFYIGNENSAGSISDYTLDVYTATASTVRYIKVKGDVLCDADETYDLGQFATKWLNIYGENIYVHYLQAIFSTVIQSNASFIPTITGFYDLGQNLSRWKNVYVVDASISDTLYVPSMRAYNPLLDLLCESSFVPAADSTHDLGTASVRWANVYADIVDCPTLNADDVNCATLTAQNGTTVTCNDDFVPVSDILYDLGSFSLYWNTTYSKVIKCETIEAKAGNIAVLGNLVPWADDSFDLGTTLVRWGTAYVDVVVCGTITAQDGTTITSSDSIVPVSGGTHNLGSSSYTWANIYGENVNTATITARDSTTVRINGKIDLYEGDGTDFETNDEVFTFNHADHPWSFYLRSQEENGNFSIEYGGVNNLRSFRITHNANPNACFTAKVSTVTDDQYIKTRNIQAYADNTYEIGTSSARFKNFYCNEITAKLNQSFLIYMPTTSTTNSVFAILSDYIGTRFVHFVVQSDGDVYNRNGTYGSLSDGRFKEGIEDARGYLSDIKRLKVRKYKLKKDPEKKNKLGFIAQEVEQVFPGLIRQGEHDDLQDAKFIKTSILIPMLVKSVQELSTLVDSRVEEINAEVSSLREENMEYRNRIERLEILVDNLISPPGAPSGEPSVKKIKTT
jgi:hypothetical protein